jgi:hypothetical protein
VIRLTACILKAFINILACLCCLCIHHRLSWYYCRSTLTMVYLWKHTLRTPQSLIRHASARLPPTLEAATPSGILPSPIKAFHCHPWFLKPRQCKESIHCSLRTALSFSFVQQSPFLGHVRLFVLAMRVLLLAGAHSSSCHLTYSLDPRTLVIGLSSH